MLAPFGFSGASSSDLSTAARIPPYFSRNRTDPGGVLALFGFVDAFTPDPENCPYSPQKTNSSQREVGFVRIPSCPRTIRIPAKPKLIGEGGLLRSDSLTFFPLDNCRKYPALIQYKTDQEGGD